LTDVAAARKSADVATSLLAQLDGILADRILVFGSLPPHGRDLDLLARRHRDYEAVADWLERHGFERRDNRWVRVDEAAVAVVELVLAQTWALPAPEVDALFAEARPIQGMCNIVHPSATHTLLILARRRLWRGDAISEKHRKRIDVAIGEDPRAWAHAEGRATVWRLGASLACLRAAHAGESPALQSRVRALFEAAAQAGGGSVVRGAGKRARRLLRVERGALFALSGLDGAGKSLQAAALAQLLGALGRDVVVVWSPLGSTGMVADLGRWGKRLVSTPRGTPAEQSSSVQPGGAVTSSTVSANDHRVVSATWVTLMGLANTLSHLRTAAMLMLGRDVVCDRYVLDSAVHLLHRYGDTRIVRLQIALISLTSPKPRRAYLLEVRPEVALGRKVDRWTEAELTERSRLYRELHTAMGARLLDAQQSRERVAVEIASDVLRSLRSP
jgi:thymidylate kinase